MLLSASSISATIYITYQICLYGGCYLPLLPPASPIPVKLKHRLTHEMPAIINLRLNVSDKGTNTAYEQSDQ